MSIGCSAQPISAVGKFYEALGFNDKDEDGVIEKKGSVTLWREEGYKENLDLNKDNKIDENEAWNHFKTNLLESQQIKVTSNLSEFSPYFTRALLYLLLDLVKKEENLCYRARNLSETAIQMIETGFSKEEVAPILEEAAMLPPKYEDRFFIIIPDDEVKKIDETWKVVAEAFARAGFAEKVSKVIEKIRTKKIKEESLGTVATQLAKGGLFKEALALAGKIEKTSSRGGATWNVALEIAKNGLYEEAFNLIKDEDVRPVILLGSKEDHINTIIITKMIQDGQYDQAMEKAKSFSDIIQIRHLVTAGAEAVKAGASKKIALKFFKEALKEIKKIDERESRLSQLRNLAIKMIEAGFSPEETSEFYKDFSDDINKRFTEDLSKAKETSDLRLLFQLAIQMKKLGFPKEEIWKLADEIFRIIKEKKEFGSSLYLFLVELSEFSQEIVKIGYPKEKLLEMFNKLSTLMQNWGKEYGRPSAEALEQVASAMAKGGLFEEARKLGEKINDRYHKTRFLADLVGALAEAGLYQEALAVAETIDTRGYFLSYKVGALLKIVEAHKAKE